MAVTIYNVYHVDRADPVFSSYDVLVATDKKNYLNKIWRGGGAPYYVKPEDAGAVRMAESVRRGLMQE